MKLKNFWIRRSLAKADHVAIGSTGGRKYLNVYRFMEVTGLEAPGKNGYQVRLQRSKNGQIKIKKSGTGYAVKFKNRTLFWTCITAFELRTGLRLKPGTEVRVKLVKVSNDRRKTNG